MKEIIKFIADTDNKYTVSNLGIIRYNNEIIPYKLDASGYCKVKIGLIIGTRWFYIHRIVAYYFCEGRSDVKNQVNHIDGNKENNNYSNLEWVSNKENQQHKINILGKNSKGKNNPMYGIKGADSPVFKGVINQIDPNTNKIINIYFGSGDAAEKTGWIASNILRVLNKNKCYHGFLWTRPADLKPCELLGHPSGLSAAKSQEIEKSSTTIENEK